MKSTIVPAQITTVEDRITGNLTLNQLVLLIAPIFLDVVFYAILPTPLKFSPYKVCLILLIDPLCWLLAIRIKTKILLFWLITIIKYNLRPNHYVFNKNDSYLRASQSPTLKSTTEEVVSFETNNYDPKPEPALTDQDRFDLLNIFNNPNLRISFMNDRKAGLHVHITEVE
jgi:hypothetical protein